ncbi:unnamed protein product [Aphanomyces euteiches]
MSSVDVLIVGAGPSGLAAACELIRNGVSSILIIDRLDAPVKQTKASVLWPRSLELLANYDGVLDAIHDHCEYVRQVKFYTETSVLTHVKLGDRFASRFQYGALLEQWYTEKVLKAYVDKHNVVTKRNAELVAFSYVSNSADTIEATILIDKGLPTERTTVVRCKYLVGCDGARSSVRRLMNCAFQGIVLPYAFIGAHFTSSTQVAVQPDEMRMSSYRAGMAFLTPMPNKSYLVAIDLSAEQDAPYCDPHHVDTHGMPIQLEFTKEQLQSLISERCVAVTIDHVIWSTHFRVNKRLAETYSDGNRIFLAGDACHCHTPLGGQGMNTGIQDAVNLGWKLALVLQGKAEPSLLTTYGTERRLVGEELIAFTTRAQNISSNRTPLVQFFRNNALRVLTSLPFVVDTIAATIGETIVAYRASPLSVENWVLPPIFPYILYRRRQNILRIFHARVVAGGRAPVLDNTPLTFHTTPGFNLIFFQGAPGHTVSPLTYDQLVAVGREVQLLTKGIVADFKVIPASEANNHDMYGVKGQCLFLVRPDGYVGLRSEPVSMDDVLRYLKHRVLLTSVPDTGSFKPTAFDWVPYVLLTLAIGGLLTTAIYLVK